MALDLPSLLRSESAAFVRAIEATAPTDVVATCPDWNADDLLWHLSEVQHFWAAIVRGRLTDPSSYEPPARASSRSGLIAGFWAAHGDLVGALDDADDDEAAWTWFAADQTVGFTRRRQVHEALIHRIDAEITARIDSTVDPELAADGVDEVLTIMFGGAPAWADSLRAGEVGEVRCTDLDRDWLVQVCRFDGTSPNTGTTYTDEPVLTVLDRGNPGDPGFHISGTAVDLDRWCWSRLPQGPIERTGDTSAVDALVAEGMH